MRIRFLVDSRGRLSLRGITKMYRYRAIPRGVTITTQLGAHCHRRLAGGGEDMLLKWRAIAPGNGHEEGRRLLAELYWERTDRGMPGLTVTQRGKPCFVDGELHFSISHTKKHVFCVLADRPVGIDAEEEDRDIDLRLAEKILSPSERLRYEKAEDKRRALLRLWVLKEAQAKMTGEGLRGYPNKTDFSPEDERVQLIDGCYVAVIEEMDNG